MRHINLEDHTPDEDWLKKSDELTQELVRLHKAGDIEARNKFIDDNAKHWGEIKEWLSSLSHGKCWFSEAEDKYSHMDVEHFRPKKQAKDLDGTENDGYWWLTFDYRNYRFCGNVGNRKKGGWFPLKDGSPRAQYKKGSLYNEEPYLLDPTDEDDVMLLAFDETGDAIPDPSIDGWRKERVDETIIRLKLNEHKPLSEARQKVWKKVDREINGFYASEDEYSRDSSNALKIKMKQHLKCLREMTMEEAPLSSVARWCILMRNDRKLSKAIA